MASYEDKVQRVIDHIHDNPAGDLSLDALANVAGVSRFHWHRIYRAITGETCAQAVRRIRLNRASHMLIQTDLSPDEVGALCGYPNGPSFSRVFREVFGLPPAAFRARGNVVFVSSDPQEGETLMYPIHIADHGPLRTAAVPHTGAYPQINRAFTQLSSLIGARGMWPQVQGMLAIYWDNPREVAEEALRSHACAIVPAELGLEAPMEEVAIPAGRHAVLEYNGPYSGLPAVYDYLYGAWLSETEAQLRDFPSFEKYLNSPMDTKPEDLKTEIYLPIQ